MGMLKYISDVLYSNDKEVLTEDSIEYGSNANGSYTKFSDGTLICRYKDTTILTGWSLLATPIFAKNSGPYTFPHAFIDIPNVSVTIESDVGYAWAGTVSNNLPTTTSSGMLRGVTTDNTSEARIGYIAIGRWK